MGLVVQNLHEVKWHLCFISENKSDVSLALWKLFYTLIRSRCLMINHFKKWINSIKSA